MSETLPAWRAHPGEHRASADRGRAGASATPAARLLRLVLSLASDPRVVRIRRFAFVIWAPLAALAVVTRGAQGALLVVAAQAAWVTALLFLAWRASAPELRGLLLDIALPEPLRRAARLEICVLGAPLLLAYERLRGRRGGVDGATEFPVGGGFELVVAGALVPAVVAETLALHLALGGGLAVVAWAGTAAGAYALLWLAGVAASIQRHPHRLYDDQLLLRVGCLYRLRIPLAAIGAVRVDRRTRILAPYLRLVGDGCAELAVGGRTDLVLELAAPVALERPFGRPVAVRRVAVAVSDPERMRAAVAEAVERRRGRPDATAHFGERAPNEQGASERCMPVRHT
ncbi:hypothetical protein [Thermoleophilum album]|uniref:PH domain-containing protein n=1 Tax=Thermoleophilum album TaxID=29539 RepID=A0A1H6FRB1_THEAL|nr:hypothetical protein [Thermoleophilum album]SEH12285.1 hypothetical protein SAMN02745716_1042 [Thermoleophilum album]